MPVPYRSEPAENSAPRPVPAESGQAPAICRSGRRRSPPALLSQREGRSPAPPRSARRWPVAARRVLSELMQRDNGHARQGRQMHLIEEHGVMGPMPLLRASPTPTARVARAIKRQDVRFVLRAMAPPILGRFMRRFAAVEPPVIFSCENNSMEYTPPPTSLGAHPAADRAVFRPQAYRRHRCDMLSNRAEGVCWARGGEGPSLMNVRRTGTAVIRATGKYRRGRVEKQLRDQ